MAQCLRIMQLRAYARAKQVVEQAEKDTDIPAWAADLVFPVQQERMRRRLAGALDTDEDE